MTTYPAVVPADEDLLGFCERCFRVRWLALVTKVDQRGNPTGCCRQCNREDEA